MVDRNRRDLDDEEGEDPVRRRRQRGGLRADGKGGVFGRQEPRHGQHSHGEEEVEEEQHHDRHHAASLAAVGDHAGQYGHAHSLPRAGKEHQVAATQSVEAPDWDQRRNEVCYAVEPSEEQRG